MVKAKSIYNKKTLPVALVFGGEGAEREISRLSAASVAGALDKLGRDYISVFIDADGFWYIIPKGRATVEDVKECEKIPTYPVKLSGQGGGFLSDGKIIPVAKVIPVLHGDMGEDGVVQGALRCAGLSFVGADTASGSLLMDKAYTKLLAEYMGIPTVPWFLYIDGADKSEFERVAVTVKQALIFARELGYPLFVKPACSGSSIGACPANNPSELTRAIRYALKSGRKVLVEKLIENPKELECAYFNGENPIFTSPGSVESEGEFYSFNRKYSGLGQVKLSANAEVNREISDRVIGYSRALCLISGVRDLARIDYFLSGDRLYFNEINSFPGMTADSLYPKMLAGAGIALEDALDRLLSVE